MKNILGPTDYQLKHTGGLGGINDLATNSLVIYGFTILYANFKLSNSLALFSP